jgi:hypothetical protein
MASEQKLQRTGGGFAALGAVSLWLTAEMFLGEAAPPRVGHLGSHTTEAEPQLILDFR